jgi:hypothetical protein
MSVRQIWIFITVDPTAGHEDSFPTDAACIMLACGKRFAFPQGRA